MFELVNLRALYRCPNNHPPAQLVAKNMPSAWKPFKTAQPNVVQLVAESRSTDVQPERLPVVTLAPPTPLSCMLNNLCYAQQIIHSCHMQGLHRKNYQAMIHSSEQSCRPTMGGRIKNSAEGHKFRSFCNWDEEILQRCIFQWEINKCIGIPNFLQINASRS